MSKNKETGKDNLVAVEEALSRTERFIEEKKTLLTIVVGGIALIIIGYMAYNRFIKFPKNAEAQQQMFMAEKYFERDSLDLARNGDASYPGFEQILSDYKRTPSANVAKYYMGVISYRQGEYEEAIKYMKSFKSKDLILKTMSIGVIGDAYMQLGDIEKGYEFYVKAAKRKPNDITTPAFLKKAGQAAELLGNFEEALGHYEEIDHDYSESIDGRDIQKYIIRAKKNGNL
jgi:tetratricopeptide (TPR) repeat protein